MEFRRTEPPPVPLSQPLQHPPPPLSYGGYRNPGFGLGNSFYNQGLGCSNDVFRLGTGQASGSFQMMNSVSAHPEILRELEKQRIRDEIISGEIFRKRVLEDEVRAEMMMEKELRLRSNACGRYFVQEESRSLGADLRGISYAREANKWISLEERFGMHSEDGLKTRERSEIQGLDIVPFQQRSTDSMVQEAGLAVKPQVFSLLQEGNKQLLLEERIAANSEEGLKTQPRCETQSLDLLPFQRRSVASKVQETAPSVTESGKQKEKIVSKVSSFLQEGNVQLSLEERIAANSEEGFKTQLRCENQSLDVLPFQRRSVQEPAPSVTENGKQKEKIVFLVKPSADHSGTKRKFESPSKGKVGYKRGKKTWTCDICQVSATSEGGLNDHLGGKRHKAMEDAINGKNIVVGFVPKTTTKPITEATSAAPNHPKELKVHREKVRKFGQAQKIKDKSKFPLWCEMCQVGAYSKTVMEAHRTGKLHSARLSEKS